MAEQSILTSCITFYSSEVVLQAKEILFNILGEAIPKRRGDNKSKSDVNDMLEALKKSDDKKSDLPKFVCDSFSKMPPVSGFEVLAEHLVSLISEVAALKDEVSTLKTLCKHQGSKDNKGDRKLHENNLKKNTDGRKVSNTLTDSNNAPRASFSHVLQSGSSQSQVNTSVNIASSSPEVHQKEDSNGRNWTTVNRRKRKDLVKGSKQFDGNFKGALDTKDLYIGRCNKDVKDDDIITFMKNDIKIEAITCSQISREEAPVKSFKITVQAEDVEKLLDPSIWPQNICVRKYFQRRKFQTPQNI